MRFGVLGPVTVWDRDGETVSVPEVKVRALLADLLVHEGERVSADRLIEDLWGEHLPGNPANALQAKVSQLRRVIGGERVIHHAHGYRLVIDKLDDEVDADTFQSLVAEARDVGDPRRRAALLTAALDLWRGPAYADFADEHFARTTVQRLAEQHLGVIEEQAEARLESGDRALLIGELADLVARHPLRERLRAVQMRALYLGGRQRESLASYAELRERLADELGLDPSPDLAALHSAILRHDESLAVTPENVRLVSDTSADVLHPSNLRTPLTRLVGRARDLDEVAQLLESGRLVTLIGPGGVGKTRIALEAAHRLVGDANVTDGVWLVELAGQHGDVTDFAQVISGVLGIRDDAPTGSPGFGGNTTATGLLAANLRDRRMLLVLDNCEHVVAPIAELAELMLHAAPGLRVLATSQEPLGLLGEAVVLVGPLHQPHAVQLFAERSAAAVPGFTLEGARAEIREAVEEICHRLDGIPLAIELAAARVRALGVEQLAARIGNRFELLNTGYRGLPARQQTLRAMIDWSWDLLGERERIVLRRLAVHSDGCTLDAAEVVSSGEGVSRNEVLDLVTRLVNRSLVVVVESTPGPRYRLLESVAAYATDRLHEANEISVVRERHLRYYLELAQRAEPNLRGGLQREWLGRLDVESANLRSALDESIRRGALPTADRADEAVRLATGLSWWWLLRGRLNEAVRTLSDVLAIAPEASELRVVRAAFALLTGDRSEPEDGAVSEIQDPVRRGRALWLYALGLFNAGAIDASEERNSEALALFVVADDRWGIAAALSLRAMHALIRGDLAGIGQSGRHSAALFDELGDDWGALQTVSPLAALAEIEGDYEEASRLQNEGLRIAEKLSLQTEVSTRLSGLGRLALLAQDWDRARELHDRARQLAIEQGYKYGEVHAAMGLALGARRSGDLDAAEAMLRRIRTEYRSSKAGEHLLLAELGFTAELRQNFEEAVAHQLLGLEAALSLGEPRALALSLEGLAGAATLSGGVSMFDYAPLLLGAADAARRSVGAPLPPAERGDVDRITTAATAALGQTAFTAAFRRGADLAPVVAAELARAVFTPSN